MAKGYVGSDYNKITIPPFVPECEAGLYRLCLVIIATAILEAQGKIKTSPDWNELPNYKKIIMEEAAGFIRGDSAFRKRWFEILCEGAELDPQAIREIFMKRLKEGRAA